MPPHETGPPVAIGDRIAFITLGRNPRALNGTVIDPLAFDGAGRPRIRVTVDRRQYFARPWAMRKLRPYPRRDTMAYNFKDLSVLAYANGFTLWHYLTTDAASDLTDGGHLDPAAEMLRVGDIIIANTGPGPSGANTPSAAMLLVTAVANEGTGQVTLTNMLANAA